jgi:hypothetical protein
MVTVDYDVLDELTHATAEAVVRLIGVPMEDEQRLRLNSTLLEFLSTELGVVFESGVPPREVEGKTYRVVRFFADSDDRDVVATGLTLEQAQAHCSSLESASESATSSAAQERTRQSGPWFDGYYKEA